MPVIIFCSCIFCVVRLAINGFGSFALGGPVTSVVVFAVKLTIYVIGLLYWMVQYTHTQM